MEKVSTGLVTISQRLRAIDENGEAIDGMSAKLQEAFGSIGVNIEDNGEQLMQQGGIYRRFVQSRELAVGWKV